MTHLGVELAGLALNIVGTLLLLFCPPAVDAWTRDGSKGTTWIGSPQQFGKARYWSRRLGYSVGLISLLTGFTLQFIALIVERHSSCA
jgi:hypothetical protein